METSEVNQIFMECDRFAKHIKYVNRSINELLKSPNKDDIDLFIRSNNELIKLTAWRLEQLADTLDHVGWWRKKVAISYINKIQHEFLLSQHGVTLLQEMSTN